MSRYSTTVGSLRRRSRPRGKTPPRRLARRRCPWPGKTWTSGADAEAAHPLNDDGGDGDDGDGGCDLALTLAQPHPHPRDGEGDHDASPPSWRLALDIETFDELARSMKTRGSSHIVLRAHHVKKIRKDGSTR